MNFSGATAVYPVIANQQQIYILDWLLDQRAKYGNLPDGVLVFDWSVGSDASRPDGMIFPDLAAFTTFGVQLEFDPSQITLGTNAYISFFCVFMVGDFYKRA